ncbi:LPS O-antigen chain length determinant protein WzzB [Rodentibacter myodis]|uniref:LPS O-antigen chain length determinant protein WzzB n=1 Tax=Rodentibacter myodis TaxID=1907939 RepID=UPI00117A5A87|nr:Wzz/FepE/Etk N-terminal domain-containing protein [Rodentibacter myodis]
MNNDIAKQDEIDLVELIKVLWNKKTWIILSAFIFTAIAGVYAFTAKEQWTSRAVVIAPKTPAFSSYYNLRQEYARILNLSDEQKDKVSRTKLSEQLFTNFSLSSKSLDVRNTFFVQSEYYKKLTEGKSDPEQRRILADLTTRYMTVVKADTKKDPDAVGTIISLSAETASEAQSELQQFIAFVNNSALGTELNDFTISLNQMIFDLQHEKIKFETDLQIQKNVQLANLENALGIAKEAGIQDYTKSFSVASSSSAQTIAMSEARIPLSDSKLSDSSYLFMLGEKYLKAQIDTLKQSEVVYPPRYYEVSSLLSQLEPLLAKIKEVKASTFSYQASPSYPVSKDKPNKMLILIIGFIFGILISIFFVLVQFFCTHLLKKVKNA